MLMNSFFDEVQYSKKPLDMQPEETKNLHTKRIVAVPEKFKEDIVALEKFMGEELTSGLCITISLQELLTILPRQRKRVDAYNSLKHYLENEMGIQLIIHSKKSKNHETRNKKWCEDQNA